MKKLSLALMLVSLLVLITMPLSTFAATNLRFTDVEVNGIDILGTSKIVHVESMYFL